MSLQTEIVKPTVSNVFLLEITAGFLLSGFILQTGSTYKVATTLNVTGVSENLSTALTVRASIALVDANPGSYYWDGSYVYIRPTGGKNIYSDTYTATLGFYFSNRPKFLNSVQYDPRINSVPVLSLRIESRFSGIGQIGGGHCVLSNNDGYFDTLDGVQWDAGHAQFKMGCDTDDASPMIYSDYQNVGYWRVNTFEKADKAFSFELIESKTSLERTIPVSTYDQTAYPLLDQKDIGKVIPLAFGKVYGAKPMAIDLSTKRFKLCGHAIQSITEIRINQNNAWVTIPIGTAYNSLGEFTLGAGWANNEEIAVDFIGYASGGTPVYDAPSIIDLILAQVGESLEATAKTTAKTALALGTDSRGVTVYSLKPSLYLDSPKTATEVISSILNVIGGFLYVDYSGLWHLEVFKPKQVTNLNAYSQNDILDGQFKRTVDNTKIFSQVIVRYAERIQDGWAQISTQTLARTQYAHGLTSVVPNNLTVALWETADADLYAQRWLTTNAQPLVKYTGQIPWQAFLTLPGDQFLLTYTRGGVNEVVEVLEAKHDLIAGKVSLVCGNRRGWIDTFGWWVADSQAAWSAGDSAATKATNKQTSGFWHGADSLAISTDPVSFETSRWF